MIKLTKKTEQDFLNAEYCKKITDLGVDMKVDAKYYIFRVSNSSDYYIDTLDNIKQESDNIITPTYTLSELLYKLSEFQVWQNKNGEDVSGFLTMWKDAPFYGFCYTERNNDKNAIGEEAYSEYPLYAAANLLIYCIKNKLHFPYVKDVSNK